MEGLSDPAFAGVRRDLTDGAVPGVHQDALSLWGEGRVPGVRRVRSAEMDERTPVGDEVQWQAFGRDVCADDTQDGSPAFGCR